MRNEPNREEYYDSFYSKVSTTANTENLSSKVMHGLLESSLKGRHFEKVLEVGALNGEHVDFVKHGYSQYLATDIRMPSQKVLDLLARKGVSFQAADVMQLPFEDNSYDRVISTCVLHHVLDPKKALQEILRVTKDQGHVSILVPNDPGFLYRTLWYLTTGRTAIRLGLLKQAKQEHSREHINSYGQIIEMAYEVFVGHDMKLRYFPFKFPSSHLNILTVLTATKGER